MTGAAGAALAPRLLRAFAGRGLEPGEAAPPRAWDPAEARAGRILAAGTEVLRSGIRRVGPAADAVVEGLAGRARGLILAAVVLVPAIRILLPPAAGTAAALALAALAGAAGLLAAVRLLHGGEFARFTGRALLGGLLLRGVLAAAIQAVGGFPDEIGYYHSLSSDAAACWANGGPSLLADHPVVQGREGYFYLLSAAYLLLGPVMAVGRVLGGLLGLAAALLAGEVARPLAGPRAAAFAVAILALHPEHALWSITLSRDTMAVVLLLAAFALLLRRPGTLLRGNLLPVGVPLALLAMNSFLVAGCLGATVAILVLAEGISGAGEGRGGFLRGALAVAAAVAALAFVGWRHGLQFTPAYFSGIRSNAIGTRPDFLPGFEFRGLGDVLSFLPFGAAFILAAPAPWTAVTWTRLAYGVPAVAGLAVTLAGLAGLVAAARRWAAVAAPLLLFTLLYLGLLALIEGNSGIVVRHRLPLTAVLSCGAAALWAGARGRAGAGTPATP